MHPLDRRPLVLVGKVGVVEATSVRISKDIDPVIDRDHDMLLRPMHPVTWHLSRDIDTPDDPASAGGEDDYRQLRFGCVIGRRPDGKAQAVFRRILSHCAGRQALSVVDDQVSCDVQRPHRKNNRDVLGTGGTERCAFIDSLRVVKAF